MMRQSFRGHLPDAFPEALLHEARDLRALGVDAVAWKRADVFQVIAWLAAHRFAILGGDVYEVDQQEVHITWDSWSCNRPSTEGAPMEWSAYVALAADKAQTYIDTFHQRNGDEFAYSLVVSDESRYDHLLAP